MATRHSGFSLLAWFVRDLILATIVAVVAVKVFQWIA